MGEIGIVKEEKATDYTLVDKSLNLNEQSEEKETPYAQKNGGTERDFRPRDDSKRRRARFKP
ncbi:hypothetical protein [Nitrososphaera sp.]|uniref:hypothetical protein n=1 Tax=Nitrososphaera sp. TaxID=1971748 RepID=UPI002ED849EF